MKQETIGWQWHQLDHMQIICTSCHTDNHAPHHLVFLQAGCSSWCPTNSVPALKAVLLNVAIGAKFMCDHVTLWNRWGNHMLDLSLSLTINWPCWLSSIVGELLHTTVRNDHCLYVSKVCSVSLLVCHRWLHIFGHVRILFWNNRSYPSFRLPLNWRSPHVTWLDGSDDDVQLANIGIHHRYINNGWSTYWSAVRRWSWIQACWWRSRSRWSDIWRSHRCLFTFFPLNIQ